MYTTEQMTDFLLADLQKLNPPTKQKEYLKNLIEVAKVEIKRKGITLDLTDISHMQCVVMYASWLYSKRFESSNAMSPMLRKRIHDILLEQKMR